MSIEISVVTPTYNRRKFIPNLIEIYYNQTYPKEQMEWIIIDDGRDKVEDLFKDAEKRIPNIRYIRKDTKMRIGEKRNLLNREARGNIIIAMDDDDYYPPKRVETVVSAFKKHPKIDLAGSSEMLLFFTDNKKIYRIGPFASNHATNGTMAWRKKYSDIHKYDEYVVLAEEGSFLDNYKHQMIQLPSQNTILVICHGDNTSDKYELRSQHLEVSHNPNTLFTQTTLKIDDIVKEQKIRDFILEL